MLGPAAIEAFKEKYGKHPSAAVEEVGKYIEYDFGGDPDILIDHVVKANHMAVPAVASAMGSMIPHYEDGLCPDCAEDIPASAVDGSSCANCGHVFSRPGASISPSGN